jgi:hypothetical protein
MFMHSEPATREALLKMTSLPSQLDRFIRKISSHKHVLAIMAIPLRWEWHSTHFPEASLFVGFKTSSIPAIIELCSGCIRPHKENEHA